MSLSMPIMTRAVSFCGLSSEAKSIPLGSFRVTELALHAQLREYRTISPASSPGGISFGSTFRLRAAGSVAAFTTTPSIEQPRIRNSVRRYIHVIVSSNVVRRSRGRYDISAVYHDVL